MHAKHAYRTLRHGTTIGAPIRSPRKIEPMSTPKHRGNSSPPAPERRRCPSAAGPLARRSRSRVLHARTARAREGYPASGRRDVFSLSTAVFPFRRCRGRRRRSSKSRSLPFQGVEYLHRAVSEMAERSAASTMVEVYRLRRNPEPNSRRPRCGAPFVSRFPRTRSSRRRNPPPPRSEAPRPAPAPWPAPASKLPAWRKSSLDEAYSISRIEPVIEKSP